MIDGEQIAARSILVARDSLEVRAFDYNSIPYDRDAVAQMPLPVYDTLAIYSGTVTRQVLEIPLAQHADLIAALVELQHRLM